VALSRLKHGFDSRWDRQSFDESQYSRTIKFLLKQLSLYLNNRVLTFDPPSRITERDKFFSSVPKQLCLSAAADAVE
jgi:hypothetical protein